MNISRPRVSIEVNSNLYGETGDFSATSTDLHNKSDAPELCMYSCRRTHDSAGNESSRKRGWRSIEASLRCGEKYNKVSPIFSFFLENLNSLHTFLVQKKIRCNANFLQIFLPSSRDKGSCFKDKKAYF